MDKTFIKNIQEKQLVALNKQIRGELANKVAGAIAVTKITVANSMGINDATDVNK